MIWDCFMFFNELDLLEIRLNVLDKHVDRFVIVEANRTHAGRRKPMHYLENNGRFSRFHGKIHHYLLEVPEGYGNGDRWAVENAQRNAIQSAFEGLRFDDIVFIGDLDEIPNLPMWNGQEGVFTGDSFYYKLNLKHFAPWNGTVALRGWRFFSPYGRMQPQDARNFRDLLRTCGHLWHFSWCGQDPREKVKAFGHAELDTSDFNPDPRKHPADGSTLLRVPIDMTFPEYVVENQDRYAHLIE